MAYLPNVPQCSRQIHQRGCSSPRFPSSTIQSGQTVLPVPSLSIVPANNDPNWEDASTNPITNTTAANRLTSSTCSQSKLHWSENTNEQLADILSQLANTLNSNQTPGPNTNTRETKAHIIAKINFAMTYLTGVAQDWFKVGLNQEDQGILQDWLSN